MSRDIPDEQKKNPFPSLFNLPSIHHPIKMLRKAEERARCGRVGSVTMSAPAKASETVGAQSKANSHSAGFAKLCPAELRIVQSGKKLIGLL
jgi:hypothetical protein